LAAVINLLISGLESSVFFGEAACIRHVVGLMKSQREFSKEKYQSNNVTDFFNGQQEQHTFSIAI
jgi:hypothetical protein